MFQMMFRTNIELLIEYDIINFDKKTERFSQNEWSIPNHLRIHILLNKLVLCVCDIVQNHCMVYVEYNSSFSFHI